MPDGLDWLVWRLVVHERQPATLRELEEHYSLEDLADANIALDLVDQLRTKMNAHAERDSKRQRPR